MSDHSEIVVGLSFVGVWVCKEVNDVLWPTEKIFGDLALDELWGLVSSSFFVACSMIGYEETRLSSLAVQVTQQQLVEKGCSALDQFIPLFAVISTGKNTSCAYPWSINILVLYTDICYSFS